VLTDKTGFNAKTDEQDEQDAKNAKHDVGDGECGPRSP
jgi:hypothetical protein